MRPNVLLAIFDAARRDAFEPYGAPSGSTPIVAQLARRGTAMPEVYATGCWTAPSHASMFTGLMPRAAGASPVPSPASAKTAMAAHEERLLPEVLRRAGYATAAVTANLWCSRASGFDGGFDEFMEVDPGRHARIGEEGWRARLQWALEGVRGKVDNGARSAGAALDAWLETVRDRPFFAFVNVMEAHSPYLPPLPYGGRSPLQRLRVAEDARRYYTLYGIWRVCSGDLEMPRAALERAAHYYRAGIRYMDDWLSERLERLDRLGLLEDTVIVVASDHGENLGENGLIAHALSLDNRLIHVPLVVAGPDAGASPMNSLAELPRYLAERIGLERHPWHDGPPTGFGLAQFDPPGKATEREEAIRRLEQVGLAHAVELFTTPLTCAVADGLKLLQRGGREEVYDLRTDPLEAQPLSTDGIDETRSSAIGALRAALDHPAVTASAPADEKRAESVDQPSPEELRELEERMKLLGYL